MNVAPHISTPRPIGTVEDLRLEIHTDLEALEDKWRALQEERTASLFQTFDWVKVAINTVELGNKLFILTGTNKDGLQFILPMVLEKHRFMSMLRWVGGSHSSTCSGLYSKNYFAKYNENISIEIFKTLKKELSGINFLYLRNQLHELSGGPNPLAKLPKQLSVDQLYGVKVSGGVEEVISFGNRRRKRRAFRQQVKVAEENGGYELYVPQTPEEINASVDDFLKNKTQRLKELGVDDVFSRPGASQLIRQLALEPMKDGVQPLRIFELRIGGKTRAMYGSGIFGDYCQSCINSVTYDELARISPGEMVLYLMIERLHADGIKYLDLGVGTEQYKISWCNDHYDLFDNLMPLNSAVAPYVFYLKTKLKVKAYLRRHDTIWPLIKKWRQKFSGGKS